MTQSIFRARPFRHGLDPSVHGTALAKRVVMLGLVNGTYYEGTQLDHLSVKLAAYH